MSLKDFLVRIGKLPAEESPDDFRNESTVDGTEKAPEDSKEVEEDFDMTIGDVFDYYKRKGMKELPSGIRINGDNWKAQP